MTREKYESLPLATLKELAKARKMKGVSTLKKSDLIDAMLALDEKEEHYSDAKNPGFPGFFCKSFTMSFSIFLWIVSVAFSLGNA